MSVGGVAARGSGVEVYLLLDTRPRHDQNVCLTVDFKPRHLSPVQVMTYAERKAAREDEIAGLKEALEILSA